MLKHLVFLFPLLPMYQLTWAFGIHRNTYNTVTTIRCSATGTALTAKRQATAQDEEGYGPFGSLLRQGPIPYVIRVTNPETYEAAVQKYMKRERCGRLEAQGNMDYYFTDPNGWAARKIKEKNGEMPPVDYTNANIDFTGLVLTAIWATGIIGLFVRIYQVQMGK